VLESELLTPLEREPALLFVLESELLAPLEREPALLFVLERLVFVVVLSVFT
jgi:hypothetical protein